MDQIRSGNFIRDMRIKKNLTQKDLADKMGITAKAISRWETGRGFPDVSLLEQLADELNVTPKEILKGEEITITNSNIFDEKESHISRRKISRITSKKIFIVDSIILMILFVTYFINNFHGYDNTYFELLTNNFSLKPFVNIIASIQTNNYYIFGKNLFICFILGTLLGYFIFYLNRNNSMKAILYVIISNLIIEFIKWIVVLGTFDINDIILRIIFGLIIIKYLFANLYIERR